MTLRHVAGFAAVLAASVALHLAAFVWVPEREGAEATGADCTALVSVQAADAALAELVAAWDAPQPTVFDTAPDAPPPAVLDQAPAATGADAAPDPAPLPRIKAPVATADLPPLPDSLALPAAQSAPQAKPKPAQAKPRQSATSSSAVAAQRAAGGTGGNAGGKQGRATAATQDPGQVQSAKAAWGAAIRARLESAKRPPPRGGAGKVALSLTILRSAALVDVRVTAGSGRPDMDHAAIQAAHRARFPQAPAALTSNSYGFAITLIFKR